MLITRQTIRSQPAEIRKYEHISWVWLFHTVIRFMPPNFRPECFLAQAYHGKFQSSVERAKIGRARPFKKTGLLHHTVHHPTISRPIAGTLKRVKAVTSSLGPGPSLIWKFQSSVQHAKIDWAWQFLRAICFMLLCIIPPKCQANSWNL